MYLKKLELQGFKSFPEKIRLEFDRGITAVVGPNGSGKSNIADAIRWVLGEQSAKSLRGGKMEDIIFAGTENRRSLGFAQVSMTIDNSENKLPLDYSEVTISRCVFRSGESEYKINGSSCRLKDIHELFMDTGIGKEGYSIISQGRIEEILSNRPEERRILFEEAAGIVKYKNRKHESQTKLEREHQNLLRINDIICELESQVEPLLQKSETAKTYLKLRDRLKLLHINIFLLDIKQLYQQITSLDASLQTITAEHMQIEETAEKQSETIADLKQKNSNLEQQMKQHNTEKNDTRINLEQKQNLINLTSEQVSNLERELERLENEIIKKQQLIQTCDEELKAESEQKQSLTKELEETKTSLENTEAEFAGVKELLNQGEEKIEQKNSEIIRLLKISNEIKDKLTRSSSKCQQLEERKKVLESDIELSKQQIADKETEISAISLNINEAEKARQQKAKAQHDLTEQNENLQKEHEKMVLQQKNISNRLSETTSRHKLLNELENSYQGYYKSVKTLLQRKKDDKNLQNGIYGAVGELVEVPKEYETAIEIAFGQSVQNIVTKTEADAAYAIEYLKKTGGGRCTFLPLTSVKSGDFGNLLNKLTVEKGFIGTAKQLVNFKPEYEPIFAHLLGRVAVVDNLENALNIFKKYNHSIKIVTLEGEVLSPGGSITGGSKGKQTENIVGRSREIKELQGEINTLNGELESCTKSIEDIKLKQQQVKQQLDENNESMQKTAIELVKYEQSLKESNTKLKEAQEKKSTAENEIHKLKEQININQGEIAENETQLQKAESQIADTQRSLNENQDSIASGRKEREEFNGKITQLKVIIGSLEGKISTAEENIKRIEKTTGQAVLEIETLKNETVEKQVLKENKKTDIISLNSEAEQYRIQLEQMETNTINLEEQKKSLQAQLDQTEQSAQETNELRLKFQNEITKLSMKKEQLELENNRLYDIMWDEYEITEKTAQEYEQIEMPLTQMKQEEKKLKQSIANLGEINVSAIAEYQAVSERYEFLKAQRDDILDAESKLQGIIKDLSKLMEEQFREQIKIISENFSIVFNEMFGGGKAFLRISDEENILESGIDIIAQPPGKKLESMLLLSGGERALTAVALLFGILRMKPSPFCILDEVEAALDDANVFKFANYIRNFSYKTQFILITHRKGTMEAADVLYGVTMQEQGVSKLISVKFEDEAV